MGRAWSLWKKVRAELAESRTNRPGAQDSGRQRAAWCWAFAHSLWALGTQQLGRRALRSRGAHGLGGTQTQRDGRYKNDETALV